MPAAAYAATPRMSVTFAPRTSSLQPPGFSSKPYDAATASNTVDTRDDASFAKHERPAACSQCCGGCAPCACGLFGWHLMGPKSSSPVVHSNLPAELWRGSATSSLIGTFEQRLRDSYRAKWVLVIFDLLIMLPAMALLSFLVLVWLDQIENAGIYRIINTNVLVISTAWTLLATVVGIFGLWSISRGSKAKSVLFALMLLGVLGLQIATGYVSYKWLNEPHFETNMAQRFSREYSNQSRALIQSSFECCGFWSDFDSPTVDGNQCFRNIVPGLLGSRPPSPPPPANPTQFFPPPRRPGATTSGVPSATATPPPPPTGQPRPTGSPTSSISASRPTSTHEASHLTSAANVAVSKQATTKRSQAGIARRHSTRVLARRQLANTPTQPQPQPSAQPSDQQRQQQSQSEQPGTPGCWPKLKAFSSGYLTMFYTMAFSHMAVTIVTLTASLMSINRFTS
ncbi:Tetraspanin family-domain-containing protein [Entophlyctis helioformis]|nr:Tetraspanin family-domain-containing protein [Entophlyctis helioformis]